MINIQEDRDFLSAQRETGRRGEMGNVDKVLTKTGGNFRRSTEDCQKKKVKRGKR